MELGFADVDAMLESMTARQYQEWLAFYMIRADEAKGARPKGAYGTGQEEQQRLSADIIRAMSGYQKRREAVIHNP